MDFNLDYLDHESPLSLKSDFILSLCELIVGGKEGLEPVQKTIIDRLLCGWSIRIITTAPTRRICRFCMPFITCCGSRKKKKLSTLQRHWKSM